MEKALRRQLGADAVDLDTQAGYARYTLARPVPIDFVAIEKAASDAGYTLKELTLTLEGEVINAPCERCAGEVAMLKISETGQLIEIEGNAPSPGTRAKGTVSGWAEGHVRISY